MEIIDLDMTPSTVTPNAHAGQYDSARTVRFMLKNGGVPFTLAGTETITAEITRSDNTEVTVNVTNTSSNYVDVVFDDTVCTVKGLYACELRLKDSDGFDIGSKNFALLVQRDPYDGAGIHVETVGPADICTFETTLPEPLQSVIVDIEATGGNGTPENPNPINGYTEASITRCGVNLWDEEWELGVIAPDGTIDSNPNFTNRRTTSFIPVVPNTTYYLKCPHNALGGRYAYYNANKELVTYNGNGFGSPNITTSSNVYYIRMSIGTGYGTIYNHDISLNYPSTDTTYHAYNGQTYTIAFGQTVYGGVLDVTRGKLHVTHGDIVLDGTQEIWISNWRPQPNSVGWYYHYDLTNNKIMEPNEVPDMLCNVSTAQTYNNMYNNDIGGVCCYTSNYAGLFVRVADTSLTTPTTINAYLANNPMTITYPLATPFDIDLTPEVISAVVGENNVAADCGQTTVKYLKAGG